MSTRTAIRTATRVSTRIRKRAPFSAGFPATLIAGLAALAAPAFAATPTSGTLNQPMTVINMGVQRAGAGSSVYFDTTEAPASALGCNYPAYYIDLTNPAGMGMYAALLTSKATGKKIVRIDWAMTSGTTCMVSIVQLEN